MNISRDGDKLVLTPEDDEEKRVLDRWHVQIRAIPTASQAAKEPVPGRISATAAEKVFLIELQEGEPRARIHEAERALTLFSPRW